MSSGKSSEFPKHVCSANVTICYGSMRSCDIFVLIQQYAVLSHSHAILGHILCYIMTSKCYCSNMWCYDVISQILQWIINR